LRDNNLNIESDDFDLIKSFNSGNRQAFNILIMKYREKVYSFTRKMLNNHDDADDVTQDIFVKLFNSLKDFRGDSKFSTYLYRVSYNFSLNLLKSRSVKYSRQDDSQDIEFAVDDDISFSDNPDSAEQTRLLEDAFRKIPEQQRAVFMLRFYEGLSYEEISKIMNKSVGGLKANYFHAIKSIESNIKKKQYFKEKYNG
jgi:RNA polymerase sigma-70 factor (ECF subfamily)